MKENNGSIAMATLVRLAVAAAFIIPGVMKLVLMGPDAFAGKLTPWLGLEGSIAMIATWLIIIAEIGGGLAILAGKLMPRALYNFSLAVLIVITLTAVVFVQPKVKGGLEIPLPMFTVYALLHVVTITVMGYLIAAPIKDITGITGDSE